MVKNSGWRNFLHALIAVLAGNLAYMLAMPYLPPGAQHRVFRHDWGIAVDFWFCLVAFGLVKLLAGWGRRRRESS